MKRKFVIFFCILFFKNACAQIIAEGRLLHDEGSSNGYSITTDVNDNIIVSGVVEYSDFNMVNVDFDPGEDEALINVVGNLDGFVCKLDPLGNFLWVVRLGGDESTSEWAQDVATDGDGNIYVAGNFSNTCDFDPSDEVFELYDSNTDGYILKLSPDGDLIWVREISSTGAARAHGLAISPNGNILVSGFLNPDAYIGDPSNALPNGSDGGFICAFDPNGNVQWTKVLQSNTSCNVVKLATDNNNNIYGIGIFNGSFDIDPGSSVVELTAVGADDAFFLKLDSSGNLLWSGMFGSTAEDWGYDIAVSQNDEVYITGHFREEVAIHATNENLIIPILTTSDALFAKLSADGELIWAHGIAAKGRGYGVATNSSGEPFFTGFFSGTADFDPSSEINLMSSFEESNDLFIAHYTTDGALDEVYSISGAFGQMGRAIHIDSNVVLLTGETSGDVDLDPGTGVISATSVSGVSFYVKLQISEPSSLNEYSVLGQVYPNPVIKGQMLQTQGFQGFARALDLSGRECQSWNVQYNDQLEINLQSGQYQIEFISEKGREVVRMIVL